jgi:hypothetical protein
VELYVCYSQYQILWFLVVSVPHRMKTSQVAILLVRDVTVLPPLSPCRAVPTPIEGVAPPSTSRHQRRQEISCQVPPSCPTPSPGMWRRNAGPARPPQSPGTALALAEAWWVYSQKPDTGHGMLPAPQLESHPHPAPKICPQSTIIYIL